MAWREDAHFTHLRLGKEAIRVDQGAWGVTYTIGADAGTTVNVELQFTDADGNNMAERVAAFWYLGDDANGDTLHAAPSGGIAIGTDGLLVTTLANQAGLIVTESDGHADVTLTQTGADTFYFVTVLPTGRLAVSDVITFTS